MPDTQPTEPTETTVRFTGSMGAPLAGVLHQPPEHARGSVVLAHCFTCSKEVLTMTRLARGLAADDIAVLRFDFTGIGDSEGEFGATNVANGVGDVIAAVDTVRAHVGGPCALVGHSLGGAASLLAAPQLDAVTTVVTIGAPSTPNHLARVRPDLDDLPDDATTDVTIAGQTFAVQRRFLDDLDAHDQAGAVAALGRPLLVLHAVDDEVVPVTEGERIFAAASQPKAFQPLLHADHLLRDRRSSDRALRLIADWLDMTW